MEIADIILIVLLGLGAVKGYLKGFVVEVFSLLAFILGLFIAIEFTVPVTLKYFEGHAWFHVISIGVFLVLFLIITIVINFIAKAIKKALDLTFFGTFDSVFGAILGIFKWALILSVVLWVFDAVGLSLPMRYVGDSFLMPIIGGVGPVVFDWIGQVLPFFRDIFDSLEKFQKKAAIA
jgi:membrane protein required for colicin V production